MQITNDLITILVISLTAGMGTGLGGLIAILSKPSKKIYGFLMGITAGVMITLSFLELVNEAWLMAGYIIATIGFGLGAGFMLAIDFFTPHIRFGEEEIRSQDPVCLAAVSHPRSVRRHRFGWYHNHDHPVNSRLIKSGLLIAIGITIHNLPEGIAVGAGFMRSPQFGLFIAMAILLHNIPEGIATALPLSQGGMRKWDAVRVAIFAGLVEPIGAMLAAFFLGTFNRLIPAALAFAGGVMVFITLDELVPAAREHGHHHMTAVGIILGALFVFILSGVFRV
jgi:ZIP family zinc transporter